MNEQTKHSRTMLEKFAPQGSTIYGIVKHVSKSGMLREIDFYVIADNQPRYLSGYIANVLGMKLGDRGLRVSGAGMDMIFAVVYDLAQRVYGDGYALKHAQL